MRTPRDTCGWLPALLLTAVACQPTQVAAELSAVVEQQVHPVLIRNDRNPLQQLTIDCPQEGVFLHSLIFSLEGTGSLEGTDDLQDLSSLEVLIPGLEQDQHAAARFGERVVPAAEIVIRGNVRLRRGSNLLELSCQLNPAASLDRKVDARCLRVETSAGTLVPVDRSPAVRKRIGVALRKHFDDGVHTYRIPALATTPAGTLLCVYDMRRRSARDLQEDIDIGLLRSTDGGQSWEAQRVIMDQGEQGGLPQEQNGCSDPGIIVDPATGEIMVAAVWTWGRPNTHQWSKGGSAPGFELNESSQFLMVRSRDDGQTWSEPENLTRQLKQQDWILFAPSPQQGIALPDGTLVMPGAGRDEQDRSFSNLIISRDHGKTWTASRPASSGTSECQAVLLGDDSIMLNCRSSRPTYFRTVVTTADLGQSWTSHATNRQALIEPACNGSLYRFDYQANGQQRPLLVFANPHSQSARDHHTLQVSFDEGRTWPTDFHTLVDAGKGRGYTSLSRVDDRHIGLVYEGSQADLVFERFSLDELLTQPGAAGRTQD